MIPTLAMVLLSLSQEAAALRDGTEKLLCTIEQPAWLPKTLVASPDGRRAAYAVQEPDGLFWVVDGKPGKVYTQISKNSPLFSPDGRRVAALASRGDGKWTVVLDDEEKAYGDVQDLAYGPGNKLVYQVKDKAGVAVGVDGVPGKTYEQIPALKGRLLPVVEGDVLRYVALSGKSVFQVEEKLK